MFSHFKFLFAVISSVMFALLLDARASLAQFDPSDVVTIEMYELIHPGGANTGVECIQGSNAFGCVVDSDSLVYTYPFNSSTITIGIDNTNGADNAQYGYPYLWDVIPQELGISGSDDVKPPAAMEAQAIASRTFIYERILHPEPLPDGYDPVNNSTQFHAFLPYKYATLNAAEQARVTESAANRVYMTESNTSYPISANYGADNLGKTTTNPGITPVSGINYLQEVADPISEAYGCWLGDANDNGQADPEEFGVTNADCGTGNGGMSSNGASRWSYGHTSARGSVAPDDPNYPHDMTARATVTFGRCVGTTRSKF